MKKSMSLGARKEMLTSIKEKYKSSDWKMRNQLLDGFIAATGYDRKHAIKLLNSKAIKKEKKQGRPAYYNIAVVQVLEMVWYASNQICSKRIVPFLPDLIAALERHGHLRTTEEIKSRVISISPATFDRLLRKERIKIKNGLSTTKPGALLKNAIKIRTYSDWNENQPGFFETDLVAHCGETTRGVFLNTLVLTDILTTWTECIPLIRKSADDVILGLNTASQLLPFRILGIDVDNGCEFINYDVMHYCEQKNITFTRARPFKKNDQAHVEEKNGSIVRRIIGYDRYESETAWKIMSNLYALLRLYINFFQPSLKLLEKVREGSKTIKKYDKAKTPYQRVLLSDHIAQSVKNELTQQYNKLDPIVLQTEIKKLQEQLWMFAYTGNIRPLSDELEASPSTSDKFQESPNAAPRFYRKTKKAPRKRDWRTRRDQFEHVKDYIEQEIQYRPTIHAKEILEKLMQTFPNQFCNGHLRTLQRRVSEIRIQQNNRELEYQELMIKKKSMTTELFIDNICV